MSFITGSVLFDLLTVSVALLVAVVAFFKWKLSYWDRVGLASLQPSMPFGNVKDLFLGKVSFGGQFCDIYNQFKAKRMRHGGVYMGPQPFYMPVHPEIIKNVLQKDFQHFVDHGGYINEKNDPLIGHLFALQGEKWRKMRVKLTPTFTSGKMKMMFQTLAACGVELSDVLDENIASQKPVDIKEIFARFTTDVIGSCAFGLDCNTLKNPEAEFRKYGKRQFEDTPWEKLKNLLQVALPAKFLDFIKFKMMKEDVEKFFMDVIRKTVDYREKNQVYRKDFMHLLLQLKNRGVVSDDEKITSHDKNVEKTITFNELAAQCFVFFMAGYKTSSTAMTFACYELAVNPRIQEKLRSEVRKVLENHDEELTYEAIMKMTYMDQVINETLRKYPPLPFLPRMCTKDYPLPNSSAIIEKGTVVLISVLGLHRDPDYYPNPDEFDPERFSSDETKKRPQFTWLPFGEGPRNCIGSRFGMMQIKVGLATMMRNFQLKLNNKTQTPLELDRHALMGVTGGIWLDIQRAA